MNPKAMTFHISPALSHRTKASYFAFLLSPGFLQFSSLDHCIASTASFAYILNGFVENGKNRSKLFDWHFYSSDIPIQNDGQLLPLIGSLYVIILQWKSLYVIIMQKPFLHSIPSITTIRGQSCEMSIFLHR